MPQLTYNGQHYPLLEGKSILDSLREQGVEIPYSCRQGICQSCLSQRLDGPADPAWQKDLRPSEMAQQYFLPCIAFPAEDVTLGPIDLAQAAIQVQITHKDYLSPTVVALTLAPLEQFAAKPGQYVTLSLPDGLTRSYSIANRVQQDREIVLHIRKVFQGQFSSWAFDQAKKGDVLFMRGPTGLCFYTLQQQPEAPMLLVGTGTGLAPLWAIVQDAILTYQHKGQIHLIHHGRTEADFYLDATVRTFAQQHPNFHYVTSIQPKEVPEMRPYATLQEEMLALLKEPAETHVYLCGNPTAVSTLERKAFLAGVPVKQILKDAFIKAEKPTATTAQSS